MGFPEPDPEYLRLAMAHALREAAAEDAKPKPIIPADQDRQPEPTSVRVCLPMSPTVH
jgi:hypothetical protein